jgi:hypothetical protein
MMGTQLPETCKEVEIKYTKKQRAPSWLHLKKFIQFQLRVCSTIM